MSIAHLHRQSSPQMPITRSRTCRKTDDYRKSPMFGERPKIGTMSVGAVMRHLRLNWEYMIQDIENSSHFQHPCQNAPSHIIIYRIIFLTN